MGIFARIVNRLTRSHHDNNTGAGGFVGFTLIRLATELDSLGARRSCYELRELVEDTSKVPP